MDYSKEVLNKFTGDYSQLFYAKEYRFVGGYSDGMRGVDIDNGSGIFLTVLPDRALDMGRLTYKGINYSHMSKAGYVSPVYYDDKGNGWLKTFSGGFLTTCGLTQVGSPCTDGEEELGVHGRISAVPAENFSISIEFDSEIPVIILKGNMRVAKTFGHNLWMKREIKIIVGDNKIHLKDEVENRGGVDAPYMILYHFNLGFPLLDQHAEFSTNAEFVRSRDNIEQQEINNRSKFELPMQGYKERVFYYTQNNNKTSTFASLYNASLKRGLKIVTNPKELSNLVHWKNAGYGDYVMGIEPANCWVEGRAKQKEYGIVQIKPGETKTQNIVIEMI